MGSALEDIKGAHYSVDTIETGLTALAIWHGNTRQASRVLSESGIEIPHTTLQDWKRKHATRLAELQEQIVPQVREKLAQQFEVIGMRSAEITLRSLDRLGDELGEIPARDLAGAIRNLGTTAAIGVDKASLLRGMPTEIRQTDSAEDILKRMQQKHPGMFVNSTAEEITEVEVVGGSPSEAPVVQLPRASSDSNAPTKGLNPSQ